jgi:large subunit ribosomal protein L31e
MIFERTYTIPLRIRTMRAAHTRRAKKAILVLRQFVEQHSKSKDIVIGQSLNDRIWERGMRNPPASVTVTIKKEKDGKVIVNLVDPQQ